MSILKKVVAMSSLGLMLLPSNSYSMALIGCSRVDKSTPTASVDYQKPKSAKSADKFYKPSEFSKPAQASAPASVKPKIIPKAARKAVMPYERVQKPIPVQTSKPVLTNPPFRNNYHVPEAARDNKLNLIQKPAYLSRMPKAPVIFNGRIFAGYNKEESLESRIIDAELGINDYTLSAGYLNSRESRNSGTNEINADPVIGNITIKENIMENLESNTVKAELGKKFGKFYAALGFSDSRAILIANARDIMDFAFSGKSYNTVTLADTTSNIESRLLSLKLNFASPSFLSGIFYANASNDQNTGTDINQNQKTYKNGLLIKEKITKREIINLSSENHNLYQANFAKDIAGLTVSAAYLLNDRKENEKRVISPGILYQAKDFAGLISAEFVSGKYSAGNDTENIRGLHANLDVYLKAAGNDIINGNFSRMFSKYSRETLDAVLDKSVNHFDTPSKSQLHLGYFEDSNEDSLSGYEAGIKYLITNNFGVSYNFGKTDQKEKHSIGAEYEF